MALLIDCDNQPPRLIGDLIAKLEGEFEITIRRAYAIWDDPPPESWSKKFREHHIEPVEHGPIPVLRKNATDHMIVNDAFRYVEQNLVESVCIVSGDSDFVVPIKTLQEHGVYVVGAALRGAAVSPMLEDVCDDYIDLRKSSAEQPDIDPRGSAANGVETAPTALDAWVPMVQAALAANQTVDGWVPLSAVGVELRRRKPEFDPRDYGEKKLVDLIGTRSDLFEIEQRTPPAAGATPLPWIRIRKASGPRTLDHRNIQW